MRKMAYQEKYFYTSAAVKPKMGILDNFFGLNLDILLNNNQAYNQ